MGGCCRCTEKGLDCKTGGRDGKETGRFKAGLSEEQVKELVEKQQNCRNFRDTVHTGRAGENPDAYQGGYHKEMQTDSQQRAFFATLKFCGSMM